MTQKISFLVDDLTDEQYDIVIDTIMAFGGYDVLADEVEPPKIVPHNRQKKPKA